MLPPAHRMRRGSEFTLTTRQGTKASRGRVVAYVHRSDPGPARVGLIVGKSVGNSVIRHRVARRLRAAAADLIPSLPDGALVVLRALPSAGDDPALAGDTASAVRGAVARLSAQVTS